MSKIYSVVFLLASIISFSAQANQILNLPTSEMVRTKLWYEGIQVHENTSISNNENTLSYPEELTVALDIMDSEKN